MEILDAIVIGSRNLTLTNPETGVSRKFKLFAVKVEVVDEVQTVEVWADPSDDAKRGTKVGVSQDESGRWNIWF